MSDNKNKVTTTNNNVVNLSPEIATVLKDLPQAKKNVILSALITKQHNGPLPDSETIRVYNEVIPNGGDRLMNAVEAQNAHRIEIEKIGVKRSFNQSATGQYMGFAIALFFGYISYDLIKSGHELSGQILGGIDLIALVTIFVTGTIKKNK